MPRIEVEPKSGKNDEKLANSEISTVSSSSAYDNDSNVVKSSSAPSTIMSNTADQGAFTLPLSVFGAANCCPGPSLGMLPVPNSHLHSLLALHLAASQLPLSEMLKVPFLANPSVTTTDIQSKLDSNATVYKSFANEPVLHTGSKINDLLKVDENGLVGGKKSPSPLLHSFSTMTTSDLTSGITNKTGLSLENLLEETVKEPTLSIAKSLVAEFKLEKDLLHLQNGQLRRENTLLRSALANSAVLSVLPRSRLVLYMGLQAG
ncbi:unnamed protein product [Thelazia callipaeda]|uniref:HMG box domain-containing protein n=1 Tax=Thelazia callipaeda TaxID=103827 RepID=A0A0N5D3U1_THECL|nr:unnamed protein product [Thelazia callipaeda]